jgi:hypothetical protein
MAKFRATHNCLAGCIGDYAINTSTTQIDDINNYTFDINPNSNRIIAESMAPYIKAKIKSSDRYITVGNQSFPTSNTAAIKSIEFGFVDKIEGKLEIIDEEGSELGFFLDSLPKCAKKIDDKSFLEFEIGWVYATCDGSSGRDSSPVVEALIGEVESSISNGIVRFIINFHALDTMAQNFRHNKTFGEETGGKQMHLEDAITELARMPPEINVRFAHYDQSNNLIYKPHKWLVDGKSIEKGPKAAWQADGLNKYNIIAKWIEGFMVDDGKNGKGVVLISDPLHPRDLIILRDHTPTADEKRETTHIATFIVNGGKCSNVLEFSPTVNFAGALAGFSSGGGTSGAISSRNELKSDKKNEVEKPHGDDAGTSTNITPSQQSFFACGSNAAKQLNESQQAHYNANKLIGYQGVKPAITAELRIIGSTFANFYGLTAKGWGAYVSIIVINPFHIKGGKAGYECGDFLNLGGCHPFFSNKDWQINGISHSVKEGSFVTTLKVTLAMPGAEVSADNTMGANNSGDQQKNTCG